MVKEFLKKIIVFIIPFLFVLNIYAEDKMIKYYYKVEGAEYIVLLTADSNNKNVKDIKISKLSSDNPSVSIPIYITTFVQGKKFELNRAGIYDYSETLDMMEMAEVFNTRDELFSDFISNPEKYKPILLFDKEGKAVLISPYFNKDVYKETFNFTSNNLNDYPDIIFKLFNADLTRIDKEEKFNFYDEIKIDKNINPRFDRVKKDAVDSDDKNNNNNNNNNNNSGGSYTGGTCTKYSKQLGLLNEKIVGKGKTKGVCSAKSLNEMQKLASLYDVKNNFDRSILEPECENAVFGDNGYLDVIIDAGIYYYGSLSNNKKQNTLSCMYLQSEYLKGISLLTSYTPITDETDTDPCELISSNVMSFINDLFDIFKVLCICVCIFLCILDVYKMVVTKESDVSKFKTVLIKRVIALVAVVLIPLLVNIVTDLINDRYLKNNNGKCPNVIRK